MSAYSEQVWDWIHEPLRDLREKCRAEPDVAWDDRLAHFLDALTLSSAQQHPVIEALAERVKQESDPIAFVSSDEFDNVVYGLVVAEAAAQETQPAPQPQPTAAPDPATVTDHAVVAIGLPAVRALVAGQPEVVAGADLADVLATVLAYRLTAQARPDATAVSTALAGYFEQQLAANPVPAGEFYALFGQDTNVAHQWVTRQVSTHANEIPTIAEADGTAGTTGAPVDDPFGLPADAVPDGSLELPPGETYLMPDLVESYLREVPGAAVLTPEQINEVIRKVLAGNPGESS